MLGGRWLEELREIGRGCIVRHLFHHYRGFFHTQRKLLGKGQPSVNELLYAYRVLMTGIFVLDTGVVEANLETLNGHFALGSVPY